MAPDFGIEPSLVGVTKIAVVADLAMAVLGIAGTRIDIGHTAVCHNKPGASAFADYSRITFCVL